MLLGRMEQDPNDSKEGKRTEPAHGDSPQSQVVLDKVLVRSRARLVARSTRRQRNAAVSDHFFGCHLAVTRSPPGGRIHPISAAANQSAGSPRPLAPRAKLCREFGRQSWLQPSPSAFASASRAACTE